MFTDILEFCLQNQLSRYFPSGRLSLSIKIGPRILALGATHPHPSFDLSFIVNEAWQRMKNALSLFLFLGAGQTRKSFWKSKELKRERPHIVFILADDLGWNEVPSLVICASIIILPNSQKIMVMVILAFHLTANCEFIASKFGAC